MKASSLKKNQVITGVFGEVPEAVPSVSMSMDDVDIMGKHEVESHIFHREHLLHTARMPRAFEDEEMQSKLVQKFEEDLMRLRTRLANLGRGDAEQQGILGLKKQIANAEALMHGLRVMGNADTLIPPLVQAVRMLKLQLAQLSEEE